MTAVLLAACTPPPEVLVGPTVLQPSEDVPYARRVALELDRPAAIEGLATDGQHEIVIRTEPSATPSFPLVGLFADRTWEVALALVDDGGRRVELDRFAFETVPLPEHFPRVDLVVAEPDAEPGYTLVPFVSPDTEGWLAALDADGEVAWLWADGGWKILEAIPSEDGVVAMLGLHRIVEMGWDGTWGRELVGSEGTGTGTPADVTHVHHEVVIEPDGSWLTMTREPVGVESFPRSYEDPRVRFPAEIGVDHVVRLDPDTGARLEDRALDASVDPDRIGYGSLNDDDHGLEWLHSNSVCADDAGAFLVSMRHQDAVVAIDRATGALRWILGTPDNWSAPWSEALLAPVGAPFEWPWHQHAAKCLGDGRVLVFDNGNEGASPWTGEPRRADEDVASRVVLFRVDEAAGTVAQEWSFAPDPPLASTLMGDADLLPGGTVLANFAHVDYVGGVSTRDLGRGDFTFQVLEFDPADGRVVWRIDAWAPGDAEFADWRSYRSERFPSFGPGGPIAR